jgi:uncharacterized protein YhdP
MRVPFDKSPAADTFMHLHGDGKAVIEHVFDREPIIEHAAKMRNEVRQTGSLRKVMSVPAPLIHQWIKEGKLGEEAFVNGSVVVDPAALQRLFREYDALRCVDKL